MESNRHSYDDHAEEDYIDMDVNSESTIFIHTKISSPQFEFQMSSSSEKDDSLPSPADELFYKGKLLPLHLPPRLQMVEKLLQNTSTYDYKLSNSNTIDDSFTTPLFTATNNSPAANNTPFESCAISPNDSRQVSRELNPEEYFSTEYTCETINRKLVCDQSQKKSWTKKLNLMKQSSAIGSKLKASRSYLKSFFNKTACTTEYSAAGEGVIFKSKESSSNKYIKVPKKNPFGQIQRSSKQETSIEILKKGSYIRGTHRRSFSGVIKRISIPRSSSSISSSGSSSSSSSSSTNSNGFIEKQRHMFKRSNSVGSDMENPIQAAIAHCKKSQELLNSRKTLSDLGFCSLSTSLIKYEDQKPAVCRG